MASPLPPGPGWSFRAGKAVALGLRKLVGPRESDLEAQRRDIAVIHGDSPPRLERFNRLWVPVAIGGRILVDVVPGFRLSRNVATARNGLSEASRLQGEPAPADEHLDPADHADPRVLLRLQPGQGQRLGPRQSPLTTLVRLVIAAQSPVRRHSSSSPAWKGTSARGPSPSRCGTSWSRRSRVVVPSLSGRP